MKVRTKPIVVEAFRWTGGPDQTEDPEWACKALQMGHIEIVSTPSRFYVEVGDAIALPGDWLVLDDGGEISVCKASHFDKYYEVLE